MCTMGCMTGADNTTIRTGRLRTRYARTGHACDGNFMHDAEGMRLDELSVPYDDA